MHRASKEGLTGGDGKQDYEDDAYAFGRDIVVWRFVPYLGFGWDWNG